MLGLYKVYLYYWQYCRIVLRIMADTVEQNIHCKSIVDLMMRLLNTDVTERWHFLKELIFLCDTIRTHMKTTPNIITLDYSRAIVVGDIHGQKTDMCMAVTQWLIEYQNDPNLRLIFLGDIPDRGPNSVECLLLLFNLIHIFPTSVYYVRGNHEEKSINSSMGFAHEIINLVTESNKNLFLTCMKFVNFVCYETTIQLVESNNTHTRSNQIWLYINSVFDLLPNIIRLSTSNDKYWLLVHGCAPRPFITHFITKHYEFETLLQFEKNHPVFTEMRWNDPTTNIVSYHSERERGLTNFVWKVCEREIRDWIEKLDGYMIIRGHQLVNGYEIFPPKENDIDEPCLLTVFTASCYGSSKRNKGAIVLLDRNTFQPIEHINNVTILRKNVDCALSYLHELLHQMKMNELSESDDECLTPFIGDDADESFPSIS